MSKKQIYYLHSCDEWRSSESMRLLFVGTSVTKLKMKIAREIREGNMEYDNYTLPRAEQARRFLADFKTLTRQEINCKLTYGIYDYCHDNEELG